ncbi:alkaline phosphatase [Microbacterium sp. P04]|uniref:alkaline phosphatase n=1 Tax=Microbacterium sp. P04 TaxID=3366947 RepID=UPI0037464A3C
MTPRTSPSRARAAWSAVAVATLALGSFTFALPATAAPIDAPITENGGATRLDHSEDRNQAIRDALINTKAKNVILLIGDGMGDSEITVARNYAEGAAGTLKGIDALPLTGQYTHWAVNADGTPNYASESASTASAWSTGTKTINGRLSVDYSTTVGADGKTKSYNPQATLLEIAKANGLKTGNVSTAEIQDATPGAEIAHISARGCYGPATMTACPDETIEKGGLGSISEQLLNVRPDVTLGGGQTSFTQSATAGPWAGQTLFNQAADRGYQVVRDAAGLAAVTEASADKPVLGLFTPGNFPVRYNTVNATVGGGALPAVPCTENAGRLPAELSLASLTTKAIGLLDNEDGFFLQVEGASIDKQDHAANACGQIGETVDLDEAVQAALAFAEKNDDTLVIVTADHAHTSQIVGGATPGLSVNLLTEEGQSMIVAYNTAAAGESQQHTGSQVRIAGYGPGAAGVIGLTDQTDLFFTSADALDLDRDLEKLSADATISVPAEVAPSTEFTATVSGLDADWQARGVLTSTAGGAPVDLGQVDVLNGVATFDDLSIADPGTYTVTITGVQTGVVKSAQVNVVVGAVAVPSPSPSASQSAVPALVGGGSSNNGSLAITGANAPWALAGIAATMIGIGVYAAYRRRRGIA